MDPLTNFIRTPQLDTDLSSEFSSEESQYFWGLAQKNPDQNLFIPDNKLCHTVYKIKEGYLVKGRLLGQGFWGKVYSASLYDIRQNLADRRVIKISYSTNFFGKFLNKVTNLKDRMIQEVSLVKKLYGCGEWIEVTEPGDKDTSVITVMPYLGATNLGKLLQSPEIIKKIPLRQWLSFFIQLTNLLKAFHNENNKIHNDIKPDNIGISLIFDGEWLYFNKINIYDFGNAHQPHTLALPGDFKYQPPEVFTFIPSWRGQNVDIYTLGKTFLEVLTIIKPHYPKNDVTTFFDPCTNLFNRMTANMDQRPDLPKVLNELFRIYNTQDEVPPSQ